MNSYRYPTNEDVMRFYGKADDRMEAVMDELTRLTAYGRALRVDAFFRTTISAQFDGELPSPVLIGYMAKRQIHPDGRMDLTWGGRVIGTLKP
jgi:hypothetical protein